MSRAVRRSTLGRTLDRALPVSAVIATIGLARPAQADLCVARVALDGDAAVVRDVGAELARLGVERGKPSPGCPAVFAQVASAEGGEGIAVVVGYAAGAKRSEGRVVSDAAIAASWIDSWLHDDLDGRAWLLAAPVQLPAHHEAGPATRTTTVVDAPPRPSMLDRLHLAVGWEHVWTDDSASADGLGIAGCVRVGRVCLGGRARYVREAERTVEPTAMARDESSLMATLSLPITAGRMSIAPELGLGVGRTGTRRVEGCASDPTMPPPNCDPMDPNCVPQPATCSDPNAGKVVVGDNFSTATYSPRLAAGVRIAIPLFDHVWLDGLAGVAVSPFSHTESFGGTGGMVDADGTVVPGTTQFALPGEPTFGMWLGVGLRVGAP